MRNVALSGLGDEEGGQRLLGEQGEAGAGNGRFGGTFHLNAAGSRTVGV